MADIVNPDVRSRMMSGIRGKNTKPELLIRRALHRRGFRYCLHAENLPGKPDIAFPSRKAVILIHGCFWHGHDCHLFHWPSSKKGFWQAKITKNRQNDLKCLQALSGIGWRVLTIWECALKGKTRLTESLMIDSTVKWLQEEIDNMELRGE